jgi:hypothetical protein
MIIFFFMVKNYIQRRMKAKQQKGNFMRQKEQLKWIFRLGVESLKALRQWLSNYIFILSVGVFVGGVGGDR